MFGGGLGETASADFGADYRNPCDGVIGLHISAEAVVGRLGFVGSLEGQGAFVFD